VTWRKKDVEAFLQQLQPPNHLGTTYDLVCIDANAFYGVTPMACSMPKQAVTTESPPRID
jgi:hypothetical protein